MFVSLPLLPRAPLAVALGQLPRLLGSATRIVPFAIQRQCILLALHQVLKLLLQAGDLDFLSGRHFQVWISDANIRWTFGLQRRRLTLHRSETAADTVIRGKLADFVLLASRQEDPDTLFFQRRLVIEGDTDLGHELKNILDTLEPETLPPQLNTALAWLAQQYQHPGE